MLSFLLSLEQDPLAALVAVAPGLSTAARRVRAPPPAARPAMLPALRSAATAHGPPAHDALCCAPRGAARHDPR